MAKPTQREVVQILMVNRGQVERDVRSGKSSVVRKNVVHWKYECPRGDECRNKGVVMFEKGTGFTNPYKHLKYCVSDGDEGHLHELYERKRIEQRNYGDKHWKSMLIPPTNTERAMFKYLRLITLKSFPISTVADSEIRAFSKFDVTFSINYTKSVMLKLTRLVEERIAKMMTQTKGAIVHDGWTSSGIHYYGVFASFMHKIQVVRNGVIEVKEEWVMPLISVSPLAKNSESDCESDNDAEATSFDAETHVRQLEDVFEFYNTNVYDWVLCSIADNCQVNKVIARKLSVPHVGCMSHRLNSEMQLMISSHGVLNRTVDSIHQTMANCRRRLRNRAMLRNLTELTPITPNATRWSGICRMMNRFLEIRDDLLLVADQDGATITIDRSAAFEARVKRFATMLSEIDVVTLELQKHGATISDCRLAIDMLIEEVREGRNNQSSSMYGCKLSERYLSTRARTVTDPSFESGVVKIQRCQESSMNTDEFDACASLLCPSQSVNSTEVQNSGGLAKKIANRKRQRLVNTARYRNCKFVIGSAAAVERLWSIAKYVHGLNRHSLTPLLFESILFLRVNETYWDIELVSRAMRSKPSDADGIVE